MNRVAGAIDVFDVLDDSSLVEEFILFTCSRVFKKDSHTAVKKCQFLKTFVKNIVFVLGRLKDLSVRFKCCLGSDLVRLANLGYRTGWYSSLVFLLVDLPFTMDFDFAPLRKEVNDRYTCLLYTSPSPRDKRQSRMPSSA